MFDNAARGIRHRWNHGSVYTLEQIVFPSFLTNRKKLILKKKEMVSPSSGLLFLYSSVLIADHNGSGALPILLIAWCIVSSTDVIIYWLVKLVPFAT